MVDAWRKAGKRHLEDLDKENTEDLDNERYYTEDLVISISASVTLYWLVGISSKLQKQQKCLSHTTSQAPNGCQVVW